MGCIGSKADINDRHPNIFQVTNVNDQGRRIKSGKLQVTNTDLVFHQRGRKPTKWPLRSLRKYGFDMDIFSFECGRRSPTGHGIYAFKCRKAEALFNVVQQRITGNITDEANGEFATGNGQVHISRRPNSAALFHAQTDGYLNPVSLSSTSRTAAESKRPDSVSSNEPLSPNLSSPPVVDLLCNEQNRIGSTSDATYTNSSAMENTFSLPQYVNLGAGEVAVDPMSTSHVYMNVDVPTYMKKDSEDDHCYANVDSERLEGLRTASDMIQAQPPLTPAAPYPFSNDRFVVDRVNYAELDLNQSGKATLEFQAEPSESSNAKEKYVTIDFQKTTALSLSKNPSMAIEEGSRKTRHNSAIDYRSSISD
ncbi:unnamed protein product [Phyllotreta striolata]|uniref:IRS-type PTB domain-containing protein n=1 Tax=Phyllotreta striolata TaxID=444603 RepID=A0A9P0DQC1_PHYSR|nr:unnamed protein product [Phyllotreta striolata]